MKTHYLLPVAALLLITLSFKTDDLSSRLYKSNEKLIFSFMVSGSKKYVTVAKDKGGKYIVYRYGTKDNVELQYPEDPDEKSWSSFVFYYVGQPAGAKTAAFETSSFSFVSKGIRYEVYRNQHPEDAANELGLNVTGNGKETNMKGDMSSQLGAVADLRNEKSIANSAGGE